MTGAGLPVRLGLPLTPPALPVLLGDRDFDADSTNTSNSLLGGVGGKSEASPSRASSRCIISLPGDDRGPGVAEMGERETE